MVRKKRQSKRITTKKRVKIEKKVTAHRREERRKNKKLNKNRIRAPSSIFLSEEERNDLAEIKKNTKIRQKIFESKFNKELKDINEYVELAESFKEAIKNEKEELN